MLCIYISHVLLIYERSVTLLETSINKINKFVKTKVTVLAYVLVERLERYNGRRWHAIGASDVAFTFFRAL